MPAKDMKGKGEGFPGLEVNKKEGQFITHRAWFTPPHPPFPRIDYCSEHGWGTKVISGTKELGNKNKINIEAISGISCRSTFAPFMFHVSAFMFQLRCSLLVKSGQKLCGEPVY